MGTVQPHPGVVQDGPMDRIFDLDRYAVDDLENPATQALIARCRQELDTTGCAVIRHFIRAESLQRMQGEAARKMDQVYWSEDNHNPYMTQDDPTLPADHPKRFFARRTSGYINSDLLDADSDLNQIYNSSTMLAFISVCLGTAPIYRWADPLGNHPYSVMGEGDYFPWHFDGNHFTVSILIQQSAAGGDFEYVPDIRDPAAENFARVGEVLHGSRAGVRCLTLHPGDMQLFKGRFSMHRVTPIRGSTKRIIALPTYMLNPVSVNPPQRAKRLYGRALPIHYERAAHRADNLTE